MIGSLSAELLKLRKRPAIWLVGAVPIAIVAALYLLTYFSAPESSAAVQRLLPQNVLAEVLRLLSFYGGAVALIFGAMCFGSEYGWDTLKVALPRRQSRLGFLSGKLLAASAALTALSVAWLLAGVLCSYVVAVFADAITEWPPIGELLKGLGAAWLITVAWGSLGALLATLFRGTALAGGLGLVYVLVVGSVIGQLARASEFFSVIEKVEIGENSFSLADSFRQYGPDAAASTTDPIHAALVLGVYLAGSVLLAMVLFWRRDVT